MSVCDACAHDPEPSRCSAFFAGEKWSIVITWRSPTTMSASPATIGFTSVATSRPSNWLSASVLTITSAPSFRDASRPAWKAVCEALVVRQPDDVVDAVLARDLDRAVGRAVVDDEQLDHVEAGDPRGRSCSVTGSESSSSKQGIWMMSFMRSEGVQSTIGAVISRLRAEGLALAVLGPILVAGLVLRVVNNDHGLPYIYYVDEGLALHEAGRRGLPRPHPGYFQNPSAYTYLLHLAVPGIVRCRSAAARRCIGGYRNNAELGVRDLARLRGRAVPCSAS